MQKTKNKKNKTGVGGGGKKKCQSSTEMLNRMDTQYDYAAGRNERRPGRLMKTESKIAVYDPLQVQAALS